MPYVSPVSTIIHLAILLMNYHPDRITYQNDCLRPEGEAVTVIRHDCVDVPKAVHQHELGFSFTGSLEVLK